MNKMLFVLLLAVMPEAYRYRSPEHTGCTEGAAAIPRVMDCRSPGWNARELAVNKSSIRAKKDPLHLKIVGA